MSQLSPSTEEAQFNLMQYDLDVFMHSLASSSLTDDLENIDPLNLTSTIPQSPVLALATIASDEIGTVANDILSVNTKNEESIACHNSGAKRARIDIATKSALIAKTKEVERLQQCRENWA